MNSHLHKFHLVGIRFNKLIVDEVSESLAQKQDLHVQIERSKAVVSKHKYGERPVIELKVGLSSRMPDDAKDAAKEQVFHVECTAGFVGAKESLDGDLDAFAECEEMFARATYWVLRERLDSVFAVTILRSAGAMPWDMVPSGSAESAKKTAPAKKRARSKASH